MEVLEAPIKLSNVVHSLLGFVLSLFLVFRTNTAYDRWWEGRKQWGALVNVSSTCYRVREFGDDAAVHGFFAAHIPGFVDALKAHLRPLQGGTPDRPSEGVWDQANHVPNAWAQSMERQAAAQLSSGAWTNQQHWLVSQKPRAHGGHPRCLRAHLEDSDSLQLQHVHEEFIFLYVVTLPLGFVNTFGWWAVPVVMLVFYILVMWSSSPRKLKIPSAWTTTICPWTAWPKPSAPTPTKSSDVAFERHRVGGPCSWRQAARWGRLEPVLQDVLTETGLIRGTQLVYMLVMGAALVGASASETGQRLALKAVLVGTWLFSAASWGWSLWAP